MAFFVFLHKIAYFILKKQKYIQQSRVHVFAMQNSATAVLVRKVLCETKALAEEEHNQKCLETNIINAIKDAISDEVIVVAEPSPTLDAAAQALLWDLKEEFSNVVSSPPFQCIHPAFVGINFCPHCQ